MAEQVNGIGLDVDCGLFEVGATLPQTGSWSIGCDVTIEDVDASVQEVRVNDISLSGSLAIPEVSVNIDANNDKVMDLEIGIATSGLSTGITESQIVPYNKIVKITEFSPESINERRFASSALAAKRIYDLINKGGAGLNEDELKDFLKRYGYVTEEYVNDILKTATNFFYLSEDGQSIGTPYNIFSEKEISANGLSVGSGGSGGGEGGGLIRNVLSSSSLGSVTSNDNFTTFNAFAIDSIYKKVKSIEEGNVSLSNYYTKSESDAKFALASSLTTVEGKIKEILTWFTIDENGNLRTELNLYSTKEISAGGLSASGGSTGGGLISTVLGIEKFGTVTTNSNTATFNAYAIDSLHKRIKSIEESEVDLTGYATEEWVMGRGFITANSLTPYLKTTDFESWKTSSFSPVASQVNTNKNNIAEILKWFAIDGDGNLYTTYNFYSTKEISSGGFDSGSNGTGGLIGVVYGKSSFGTIANEANNATFNAYAIDSLYKRIVSLENKEVDLTGYATEAWVAGQGFITSAALSPYMKTADANDTFATKTALNNLSSNHDSLAARVSTAEGNISANATAITNLGKRVTANEGNIAEILKWFAEDSEGNLCTTYNFYSTKEISSNGLSIGTGGSGGGLISQVYGTTAFGTIASESNSATFNAYAIDSLYKRIVSLEGKATAVSFVPALTSGKMIGTLSIDGVSTVLYGVDAYSKTEADSTFLKLSGGSLTGQLKVTTANWAQQIILDTSANSSGINLSVNGALSGIIRGDASHNLKWYYSDSNDYTILHSGNYNSYAPKRDGTGASGTWGIDISGKARGLVTSVFATINANEITYTDCIMRYLSAISNTSTNLPVSSSYQNSLLVLPLHDNGATAQMYFTRNDEHIYYRSHHTAAWKAIAFTDSNVASATKLATARTIWGQSFDGTGNVSGSLKTPSGYNAVTILDSYLVLGQGMAENSLPTYLDGYNVYMRYGKSSTIGFTLNSSGNVGIGTDAPTEKLHVAGKGLFTDNLTSQGNVIGNGGVICKRGNNQIELNYYISGNRGLFDSSTSKWLIYTNGTNVYIPLGALTISNAVTMDSSLNVGTVINVGSNIMPKTNETSYLGSTSLRFLAVCAKIGDFSGAVTMSSTLSVTGATTMNSTLTVNGAIAAASTIRANSVISATSRLRVDAPNSTVSFGFIDAALYGTTTNVSTVHIGSCYGGSSTITNTGEYPNGVSMTAISIYRGVVGIGKRFADSELRAAYGEGVSLTTSGGLTSTGLITASSGVKVASGQAITFLDASGKEHKLTYDSTAGAFKFDGNILVTGDGQFNAIN